MPDTSPSGPALSPPVAGAAYADVAGRTEQLAHAYAGWTPPAAGDVDPGRALVRVFARMAQHVVDRINQVPDRSFLAFLDRLGVEAGPTRAARVPLTFSLVQQSAAEPVVPAGTRVGASAVPGDTREVVFTTEVELPTTRAALVAAFVQQPDGDRIADVTAAARGTGGPYHAFDGGAPVEHALYLAADPVLGLPAGTSVTVSFGIAAADVPRWKALSATPLPPLTADVYYKTTVPDPPLLRWAYWNGAAWTKLAPTSAGDTTFTFAIPGDASAVAVNGVTARWIRLELLAWPAAGVPALATGVGIQANPTQSSPPDAALVGGRPADLSVEFYPFGEQPKLNAMFHVACDKLLSRPGATVTVAITPSPSVAALTASDAPVLAWEISTSAGWVKLLETKPTIATTPFPNDALRTTSFTVPANVAPTNVGGTTACWLRVRLSAGGYGKGFYAQAPSVTLVNDGYRPPILRGVTLSSTFTASASPPTCLRLGDLAFADATAESPLRPFVRSAATQPAVYLGFAAAFAPRDALLYLEVPPLAPADAAKDATAGAGPRVVWEYAVGTGWAPLPCEDETQGLATSGLLRFVGPGDMARRTVLGQGLYWLRASLAPGAAAAAARLGRVLTNTVWASDAVAVVDEVLGSGDGSAGQSFSFAERPVLAGQRVEVDEGAIPPDAERAAIEALEGPDAIAVAGDPARPSAVWVRWHEVADFLASGPRDRCYVVDRAGGAVTFGDGQRGLPPPRGVGNVRAAGYRAGGGADGNRAAATIAELKTTIPYVDGVVSPVPSSGGADREGNDRVKVWGPRVLRHGHRAVAAEDFEDLALEASPAVARSKAITPSFDPIDLADTPGVPPAAQPGVPAPGGVVLLLVTNGPEVPPTPSVGLLQGVAGYLRARAAPAVGLRVAGPTWIRVSVTDLAVVSSSPVGIEALRERIAGALSAFFHPVTGGADGTGWDFGTFPYPSDVYRLVMSIPGVDRVGALQIGMVPELAPDDPALPGATAYLAGVASGSLGGDAFPASARMVVYPGQQVVRVTAGGA